jgi:hypothetical protein
MISTAFAGGRRHATSSPFKSHGCIQLKAAVDDAYLLTHELCATSGPVVTYRGTSYAYTVSTKAWNVAYSTLRDAIEDADVGAPSLLKPMGLRQLMGVETDTANGDLFESLLASGAAKDIPLHLPHVFLCTLHRVPDEHVFLGYHPGSYTWFVLAHGTATSSASLLELLLCGKQLSLPKSSTPQR